MLIDAHQTFRCPDTGVSGVTRSGRFFMIINLLKRLQEQLQVNVSVACRRAGD